MSMVKESEQFDVIAGVDDFFTTMVDRYSYELFSWLHILRGRNVFRSGLRGASRAVGTL